jgi:hypothetical protein
MGELTLVLELGNQHHLRSTCNVATAVGLEIHQGHSAALQSTLFCSCGIGPICKLGYLGNWLMDVLDASLTSPEKAALTLPSEIADAIY